jgi:hypothetical protein
LLKIVLNTLGGGGGRGGGDCSELVWIPPSFLSFTVTPFSVTSSSVVSSSSFVAEADIEVPRYLDTKRAISGVTEVDFDDVDEEDDDDDNDDDVD